MRGLKPPAQRIDLRLPGNEPGLLDITTASYAWVAGIGTLLLALAWLGMHWQIGRLEAQQQGMQAQLVTRQAQLAQLQQRLPPDQPDAVMQTELRQLIASRDDLDRAIRLIADHEAYADGFGAWFRGLARNPVDGLWFDRIQVADAGRELLLRGYSQRPELVPQLLRALGREPAFAGRSFHRLSMQRDTNDDAAQLQFELRSVPQEERGG